MIYIIYGASGSGKTTLLHSVYNEFGKRAINKKGTTRKKRTYDCFDEIESFPQGLPKDRFYNGNGYVYSQYGYDYGIEKIQLEQAIEGNYPHFVICNDLEVIRQIRKDFPGNIVVIYLEFDAPEESIAQIQKARDINDDEIQSRLSKISFLKQQFRKYHELFDHVILNHYGRNPSIDLWTQVAAIMSVYKDIREIPNKQDMREMIQELIETNKQLAISSGDDSRKYAAPIIEKGFVFIIMPMNQENEAIKESLHNVYATIKLTALDIGYRAEKADKISESGFIDAKIFEHLKRAELVIADLTHERPNCYLEFGYALALNKKIILLYKNGTKLHFDVEHYDLKIKFDSTVDLARELKECLMEFKTKAV